MSFRRSIPRGLKPAEAEAGTAPQKKKRGRKAFSPTERELQFVQLVASSIKENFPNASEYSMEKIISHGPKVVRKLSRIFGFTRVRDVLLWGLEDHFWRKQIRSISPLGMPSRNDPDRLKFEVLADCYDRSLSFQKFDLDGEVRRIAESYYADEEDRQIFVDDAEWFIEKVEEINGKGSKDLIWTRSFKVLYVLEGFAKLERDIVDTERYPTWGYLINEYIEYLKQKVLKPEADLYPGHFDRWKQAFRTFVRYAEKKHGTSILEY